MVRFSTRLRRAMAWAMSLAVSIVILLQKKEQGDCERDAEQAAAKDQNDIV
jgi:hypothetical protein